MFIAKKAEGRKKNTPSPEDRWYHENATRGLQFLVGGIIFSLTGVGLVIGLPLALYGYSLYNNAPGPVKDVQIEE